MLRIEGVELCAGNSAGNSDRSPALLSDAELSVAAGEVRVIYGESGTGKSSLLRLLTGLAMPNRGEVCAMGRNLARLRNSSLQRLRRRLALIEESPRFLEDRTAFANVALGLEILAVPRAELRARTAEALASVGLAEKVDVIAARLSRSERLWLAVARALARRPAVVLADEPWRDLGELGRDRFCNLIDELAADGAACIVTTGDHSMVELAELWSWSVSELRDGLIVPFHEVAQSDALALAEMEVDIDLDAEDTDITPIEVTGLAEVLPFPIRAEASGAN